MASSSRLLLSLGLSHDEREIFCSLDLKNESLQNERKKIANELSLLYETGSQEGYQDESRVEPYKSKTVTIDTYKANKYKEIADGTPIIEQPLLSTENFFTFTAWFTSTRLFLIRTNSIAGFFKQAFLPSLFSIGGLSYAVTLSVDIVDVLYTTFRQPLNEEEASLSYWTRFKNAMQEPDRLSRMANDTLWLAFNLTTFILTGGFSSILNIIGFGFDLAHEVVNSIVDFKRHDKLTHKIWKKIDETNEEIKKLNTVIESLQKIKNNLIKSRMNLIESGSAPEVELCQLDKKILKLDEKILEKEKDPRLESLKNDRSELFEIKVQVEEKTRWVLVNRLRIVVGVFLACVGLVLVLFPLTTVPGIALIGSGCALFGGSVITGLGKRLFDVTATQSKRLWNKISNFFSPPTPLAPKGKLARDATQSLPQTNTNLVVVRRLEHLETEYSKPPEDLPLTQENKSVITVVIPAKSKSIPIPKGKEKEDRPIAATPMIHSM